MTKFAYDGLGRLSLVTNALNKVTKYQYDEVGNLTNQVDALNRSTKFEYDSLGRRNKRIVPGAQAEWLVYDAVGNLIRHTNFNQVVITNAYDSMNRLLSKSTTNGTVLVSYLYSKTGLRTNMTDASGSYGYIYDDRDRLRTNTTPQGTLHYSYDLNGNLTNLVSTTANGVSITYEYDALNRITNAIDNRLSGTKNTAYTFDGVGNLKTLTYPNGITNLWQYDSLNRLTNLTWKLNGAQRGDFAYKLGPSGNRTNVAELNGRTVGYGYDALYRLTTETVSNDPSGPNGTLSYSYDGVGNRTNRAGSGSITNSLPPLAYGYDANDRLNSDTYDNNGNTTVLMGTNCVYNFENQLTNFNNGAVIIVYNGDGLRVRKSTSTTTNYYLVADRNLTGYPQVVEELTTVGGTPTRLYTFGHSLISQRQSSGAISFYVLDGHENVRYLAGTNGSLTDTNIFDAFGYCLYQSGTTPNDYLYAGEMFDPNLGLVYLRARWLNPRTGRFTSMDSWEGNRFDPPSLHKYAAFRSDPMNRMDPSGHVDFNVQSLMSSMAIRVGLAGGLTGAIYGGYYAHRTGGNVWAGAGIGFAAGFTTGYMLGPLPAAAFQTKAAITLFAALSVYQVRNAVNLYYAGYYDLAFMEGAIGIAIPFGIRSGATPIAPKYEPPQGTLKIFRGVHGRHPQLEAARKGEAHPMGGHADPYEHNTIGDVESIFTSWTTDRSVAASRAKLYESEGQIGVVLELEVPQAKIIDSPDVHAEAEVLLKGNVKGATVTDP